TFGPDGDLYVSSLSRATIGRYDGRTGAFLGIVASGGGLSQAGGFAFGLDGNLYACDRPNNRVLRFDGTTGQFIDVFISPGTGGLQGPGGLLFTTEPGLSGWTIYLDQNQNGHRDADERFATTDANGNYAFTGLPAGTYFVAEEGQPGWQQTAPAGGTYQVTLGPDQIITGQDFGNVAVSSSDNRSPVITSIAPITATAGQTYVYRVAASDPDGDPLQFDLPVKPDGMTIDGQTGVVAWISGDDQAGGNDVILRVRDGRGGVKLQSFVIDVTASDVTPVA